MPRYLVERSFPDGLDIPDLHRFVPRGAGEPFAIRAECHARDTLRMPLYGEEFLAGLGIPHLHRVVLGRSGQALAGLMGRDYVIPDDIKALAEPALAHRLIIKTSSSIHDGWRW